RAPQRFGPPARGAPPSPVSAGPRQRLRWRSVTNVAGSHVSTRRARANSDAPWPTRSTCRPSSITALARSTGWRTSRTAPTAPARSVVPSMSPASSSTSPSRFRLAPMPALSAGSSSRRRTAATTASSAPPSARASQPASRARSIAACREAYSSGCGAPAPPGPIRRPMGRVLSVAYLAAQLSELAVDAALRRAAFELVSRTEVHEARVRGKPGMHLAYSPEHLLRHLAVVGVALRPAAQLAQVVDLAEAGSEEPAKAERERDGILRQSRPQRLLQGCLGGGGVFHGLPEASVKAVVSQLRGEVVAQGRSQRLP